MRLNDPAAYRLADETTIIAERLDLRGRRVLELGCGAAWMTRWLAERFAPASLVATEVDRTQHAKNLALEIPGVEFCLGGAEAIAQPDASQEIVFLFKSLHHVPRAHLTQAMSEIHRVLVPGGWAYFSEPVYWGPFNDLLRLVRDEKAVREAAFQALVAAVEDGQFVAVAEIFFQSPGTYATWEEFEQRFLQVTHTELNLEESHRQRIREAFLAHMTPSGAHFLKPHRVNLLRKPG